MMGMGRDGVRHNKNIKVLNMEEDGQWNYPNKILLGEKLSGG